MVLEYNETDFYFAFAQKRTGKDGMHRSPLQQCTLV